MSSFPRGPKDEMPQHCSTTVGDDTVAAEDKLNEPLQAQPLHQGASNFTLLTLPNLVLFLGISAICFILFSGPSTSTVSISKFLDFSSNSQVEVTRITKAERAQYGFQRVGYDKYTYFGENASDVLTYAILDSMDAIIEPYADTQMKFFGDEDSLDSGTHFSFSVVEKATDEELCGGKMFPSESEAESSSTVSCACTPLSELQVQVSKYNRASKLEEKFNLNALCMSVRRELRSLTSADLTKTMDAMYTMWTTSDSEGQALYGSNYHGIDFLTSTHDFNAAQPDGDHIHEGLGFLPQHIKISNIFEASMQAVDPSVSLFYWDFTIESTAETDIFDSPMFTADTFGSLTKSKGEGDEQWFWTTDSVSDGYVPDGRWSMLKAHRNSFSSIPSAYGYMRGPWCMNPAPLVTRFPGATDSVFGLELPSCRSYVSWLKDDDKMSFLETAEDAPHAVAHGIVGGVFGCDSLQEMQDAGYLQQGSKALSVICQKWTFFMKELYRAQLITPDKRCTAGSALEKDTLSCGFSCPDSEAEDWIAAFSKYKIASYVPDDMDESVGWEAWRQFACNGNGIKMFTGDQLESASPNDPSFWPIHPTMERLYHAKMMAGGFEEDEWPSETCGGGHCDWVCNHAKCYDFSGVETTKAYYDSCCAGHFENDQLFDHNYEDRSQGYGLTNAQVFLYSDPTSKAYNMTYLYDNFEWAHCAGEASVKDVRQTILDLAEEKAERRKRRSLRRTA